MPTNFLKSKTITILTIIAFFSALAFLLFHQGYIFNPANFQECSSLKASIIQESYPATCVTVSGESFIQQLSASERQQLLPPTDEGQFSCPDSGYIDCMPSIGDQTKDCSDLRIKWAEDNCPSFQGIAY